MTRCWMVCFATLSLACAPTHDVVIELPDGLSPDGLRFEVSVVESCLLQALNEPAEAPLRQVSFDADAPADAIGEIGEGTYGLFGQAIGMDCRIVASGCERVDVKRRGSEAFRVALTPVDANFCAPGQTCDAGRCLGGSDAGHGDVPIMDAGRDALGDAGAHDDAADSSADSAADAIVDAAADVMADGGPCPLGSYADTVRDSAPLHYYPLNEEPGASVVTPGTASSAPARYMGSVQLGLVGAFPSSGTAMYTSGDDVSGGGKLRVDGAVEGHDTFSVEYWLRIDVLPDDLRIGINIFTSETFRMNGFRIGVDNTGRHYFTTTQSVLPELAGTYMSDTQPVVLGEWIYLVWVVDADEARLYRNGERTNVFAPPVFTRGTSIHTGMGAIQGLGGGHFTDELAYYDRALTDAEVRAHYDAAMTCD